MTAEALSSTPSVPRSANPPKTAFVFAGGGSFGSVQVGMLRALLSHGVTADMVVGSSVGAMNAAYFAGMPTTEGVERLAGIWRSLRRKDVFPINVANRARLYPTARFSHFSRWRAPANRHPRTLPQPGGCEAPAACGRDRSSLRRDRRPIERTRGASNCCVNRHPRCFRPRAARRPLPRRWRDHVQHAG
jgi:hypothetical protein